MPLSGRDFNSLLNVIPGVQHRPGGGFQGVNVSGARTSSNNFMIDGISNNDRYYGDSVMNQTGVVGVPATLVPVDAIGDFTVQQTPSAEFGVKGGAAINIVMKSGGNVPHGTGYYFRHDDWTDAPNYFVKRAAAAAGTSADATPTKNQQYGGTFGGPLRRDKTFYFGYYEGQRLAVTSPYVVHVPTPARISAARARIAAAGLQTNPIGENLLKFYPTDPTGSINVNAPNVSNMNTFSVKVDHNLNANNLINGRVFYGRNFQSAPAGNSGEIVPPNGPVDMFNSVTDPTVASLAGFVWNSTLSDRTLLETRVGFNLFSQTIEPNNKIDPQSLGINTGPLDAEDLGVPGVTTPFGHIGGVGGYPITTKPTTTTQFSVALTQTRGPHTFKTGGTWDYAYNRSVRNQARTTLTANGRTSSDVDALVGLLLARFENAARSFGQTERHMSQTSFGVFINDDWKVTSRLTLSAGVRYELFSPVKEQDNLATNFFPDRGLVQVGQGIDKLYNADTNNFGPRAGLAWDVMGDGQTSVRAGYALTYDSAQIGVVHPGLFSTPTLGVFRVARADAALHARQPAGDLRQSEQLGGRRRLRLSAAGRTSVRQLTDRRAAVQHLPGAGRFRAGSLSLLPHHRAAADRQQQLGHGVVRRVARSRSGVAQGDQRAAARISDDEPGPAAAVPIDVPAIPQHRRLHQRRPIRHTTACSCRSGRTRGTASTRSTATRCRIAPTTTRAIATEPTRRQPTRTIPRRTRDRATSTSATISAPAAATKSRRVDGRRSAADRPGVLGALRPAVHARSGHDRCVGSGHRRDPRQLPRRTDLQLRPRLSVPQRHDQPLGDHQRGAGIRQPGAGNARHLRAQQRPPAGILRARHEHPEGVQAAWHRGFRRAGRSST